MGNLLKHFKVVAKAEFDRYIRWRLRIFFDIFGSLMGFLGFLLVWIAVLEGGFEGLGMLNKDNYLVFILSGSLMWTVMVSAFARMSGRFVREKHRKTLAYLMMSPLNRISYLYGSLSVVIFNIFIRNIPKVIVALLIGFSFEGSLLATFLVFLFAFLAFSGLGIMLSILSAWKESLSKSTRVITRLLYLLSGVYYPLEVFPAPVENVLRYLPTTQAIDAVRLIGIKGAGLSEIWGTLVYLALLSVISIVIGIYMFNKMARKAMHLGL